MTSDTGTRTSQPHHVPEAQHHESQEEVQVPGSPHGPRLPALQSGRGTQGTRLSTSFLNPQRKRLIGFILVVACHVEIEG